MTSFLRLAYQRSKTLFEACLPSHCLLCDLPSQQSLICQCCHHAILTERPCCLHCGSALVISQPFCGECIKHRFAFQQLHAIASYQSPYPALIKQLKYNNQLLFADLLGLLLATSVKQRYKPQQLQQIDGLIPVPLHINKLRTRGFNQANLITNALIKNLPLQIVKEQVIRNKITTPQEGLSRQQRALNLEGAFSLTPQDQHSLQGKYVVIIDDVVTTGATINSLCHCLLKAKVKRIDVWCICRTELQ